MVVVGVAGGGGDVLTVSVVGATVFFVVVLGVIAVVGFTVVMVAEVIGVADVVVVVVGGDLLGVSNCGVVGRVVFLSVALLCGVVGGAGSAVLKYCDDVRRGGVLGARQSSEKYQVICFHLKIGLILVSN